MQVCYHLQLCYTCVMQKSPTKCPTCFADVMGWVRTTPVVPSPLKHNTIGVNCDNATSVKSTIALKLNRSSAFDALVVPNIETAQTSKTKVTTHTSNSKVITQQPTRSLKMEIYGQKESLLESESESESEESDEDLRFGLVHYPPQPIIHRHAKGHGQGWFGDWSSSESDPEDEDHATILQEPVRQKKDPLDSIGNTMSTDPIEVGALALMTEKDG